MIESILTIISGVGTVASTANSVISLVQKVKQLLKENQDPQSMFGPRPDIPTPSMQPFQPRCDDRFAGGNQWLSQLQNLAASFGDSWVPQQTYGLLGIDLTGIWSPPFNPYDQTYIRQYGPYLNIIAGVGGMPTGYGEGLFDPTHRVIHVVGRNNMGVPLECRAQLLPNWSLQGTMMTYNAWGMPVQMPLLMMKVA